MTFWKTSLVSARQAIAEQRGLPKGEAKAFCGAGVHSARGVAYQHGSATVHAPQSLGDGDRASFAGSEFGIFEACAEFREFSQRVFESQPQLRAGRDQRYANLFAADGRDVHLAVTAPVQFHEAGPRRNAILAPEGEAQILFRGRIQLG